MPAGRMKIKQVNKTKYDNVAAAVQEKEV